MSLGEALHVEITFRAHTRRDAAEELGVSVRTLQGWLSDRVKPDSNHMAAVVRYLGREEVSWQDEGRGGRRSSKRRR